MTSQRELIDCPYCHSSSYRLWAEDNGFSAVKCESCGLVYVNPRPKQDLIDEAVKTGMHSEDANSKNVVTRRVDRKMRLYHKTLGALLADVWQAKKPISWLDVGAGFGEILEAVQMLSAEGSRIVGLEPMKPKADAARKRGLNVEGKFLNQVDDQFHFLSLFNVFSHIPDFRSFLVDARKVLEPGGEIIIETGDTADLQPRQVPGELDLPDHLVFAAESHLRGFLEESGFKIIAVQKHRIDTFAECTKDFVKKLLGKPVQLSWPYTSPYRTMFVRAKICT